MTLDLFPTSIGPRNIMNAITPEPSATRSGVPVNRPQVLDRASFRYSIVVPVFNSADLVGRTIDEIVKVFTEAELDFELILVNDGSADESWAVISQKAREIPQLIALDLLKNYGQHNANLAGFREATGDYVITMDDDLQNPPDQALVLIDKAMHGHDVVFGKFEQKQHARHRKLGSKAISAINRRVFGQPPDLAISNFRILRRDVVDRICVSRTAHPYITGQALLYSRDRAHVVVRHEPRPAGHSSYNFARILRLVLTILFSYSSFPMRFAAVIGFTIAGVSFVLGAVYLIQGLFGDTQVPGWTTLVVLLAIFNGFIIALLSMLGEYVMRTLNAVSAQDTYHVSHRVD